MLVCFPNWSDRVIFECNLICTPGILLTGILGLLIVWRCLWAIDRAGARAGADGRGPVCALVGDARCRGVLRDSRNILGRADPAALAPAMFLGRWIEMT